MTTDQKKMKVLIVFILLLLITGCSAGRNQGEAENETSGMEVREDQPNTLSENIGQNEPSDSDQPQNLSEQEYAFVSWEDAGLEDHVMDWQDKNLEAAMKEAVGIQERDIMLSDVCE